MPRIHEFFQIIRENFFRSEKEKRVFVAKVQMNQISYELGNEVKLPYRGDREGLHLIGLNVLRIIRRR